MQELIQTFIARLPARAEKMLELVRERDLGQLRQVVHQLKGAGGGYGFSEITKRATEAERTIKSNATLEAITAEIESLIRLLQRVDGYDINQEAAHVAEAACH